MARMVFGNWASSEPTPTKVDHLRAGGGKTLCGRKITRTMKVWNRDVPRMATCKRCRALTEGRPLIDLDLVEPA